MAGDNTRELTGILSDVEGCSGELLTIADSTSGILISYLEALLEQHHSKIMMAVDNALSRHLGEGSMVAQKPTSAPPSPAHGDPFALPEGSIELLESVQDATPARFAFKTSSGSYSTAEVEKRASAQTATADSLAKTVLEKSKKFLSAPEKQSWLRRLTKSLTFEIVCALLIISNAIFFGAEVQYLAWSATREYAETFKVGGIVFTMIFAIELLLRMSTNVSEFFFCKQWQWNLLDTIIVMVSVAEVMLCSFGIDTSSAANLTFVRVVRLGRTVRIFRFVKHVKLLTSLRILVHSVLNTLKSLAWTVLLLIIILYVFGLVFTQASLGYLENPKSAEVAEILSTYYGSLLASVYTLFKAITNGLSWQDVARPLGEVHPTWEVIFVVYIMFTYLAVLNVVTGLFCNSAIESANQDRDALVQAQLSMTEVYTEQLRRLFKQIDNDRSGVLTLTGFEDCLKDPNVKAYFDGLDLTTDDAWNLFKLLDTDESNSIDMEEFVEGCLKLRGRARSIDIHMLLYESRWTMKRVAESLRVLKAVHDLPGLSQLQLPRRRTVSSINPGMSPGGARDDPKSNSQEVSLPSPEREVLVEGPIKCRL